MSIQPLSALLLISFAAWISGDDPPMLQCEQNRDICTFHGLSLTRGGHRFSPVASNATEVKLVIIENSTIEWFSSDLCNYFPNLKEIDIFGAGIEGFDDNALMKCRNLEVFESTGDKFKRIPLSLFHANPKLRSFAFYGAPIERIDPNQFVNLPELRFITIASGRLSHFPLESIRNSRKLIGLYLHGNHLVNLDGTTILEWFPMLRAVAYSDNDMVCRTVRELNELLWYNGVDVYQWVFGRPKPRDRPMGSHWGIICLAEPEPATLHVLQKHPLNSSGASLAQPFYEGS